MMTTIQVTHLRLLHQLGPTHVARRAFIVRPSPSLEHVTKGDGPRVRRQHGRTLN
jgi:hypothetical protein